MNQNKVIQAVQERKKRKEMKKLKEINNFDGSICLLFVNVKISDFTNRIIMNRSEIDEDDVPMYKIIIVGHTSIGKTKLLIRYKFGVYEDEGIVTIGVDSHVVKTSKAKFRYYDTAGQDIYRAIIDSYYRGSDACLICYDVTSKASFS